MIRQLFKLIFGGRDPDPDIEEAKLSAEYPDWKGTVRTLVFKRWVERQPFRIQVLYKSEYGDDVLIVLRMYHSQPFPRLVMK